MGHFGHQLLKSRKILQIRHMIQLLNGNRLITRIYLTTKMTRDHTYPHNYALFSPSPNAVLFSTRYPDPTPNTAAQLTIKRRLLMTHTQKYENET